MYIKTELGYTPPPLQHTPPINIPHLLGGRCQVKSDISTYILCLKLEIQGKVLA